MSTDITGTYAGRQRKKKGVIRGADPASANGTLLLLYPQLAILHFEVWIFNTALHVRTFNISTELKLEVL